VIKLSLEGVIAEGYDDLFGRAWGDRESRLVEIDNVDAARWAGLDRLHRELSF
jgi:hypothetical protein